MIIIFHCTLKNKKKANTILIISKTFNCKRSKFFPHNVRWFNFNLSTLKNVNLFFSLIGKLSFCFCSYFWKNILLKSWNLLRSLIKQRAMTGHFLVSVSMCLSLYAFPGMEYQEISVGFTFLMIPMLGKRQFCVSELFSVNAYTNIQW